MYSEKPKDALLPLIIRVVTSSVAVDELGARRASAITLLLAPLLLPIAPVLEGER